MSEEMMQVVLEAMKAYYAPQMPERYSIHSISEYDPEHHTAPNLWFEKRNNPSAKYLAIISGHNSSTPALGETVTDAIDFALSKIARRQ